ncbi:unnamed protein product [Dimorphilus gyrociliatus]|uniref:Uncharacterized protein n=1 Tax=Dimorphilus gyrociliatus TaxID=2664684 RepID=A0A7I8WB20_9ANNE|nr:unnamed protein product [Dimorphilus gyrociliatus]
MQENTADMVERDELLHQLRLSVKMMVNMRAFALKILSTKEAKSMEKHPSIVALKIRVDQMTITLQQVMNYLYWADLFDNSNITRGNQ